MIGRMTKTVRTTNGRPRRWLPIASALLMMSACTGVARADDDDVPDARLAGYRTPAEIGGGSAGAFALLGLLSAITIGVMFKNANRSHLD